MKKISSLVLGLALLSGIFSSCEKYLDVSLVDQANIEDVFSQTETVRKYLSHIYTYIPLEEDLVYGSGSVVARTDMARFSWYSKGRSEYFRTGQYSSATLAGDALGYNDYWDNYYEGVRQCTIFINNIDLDRKDTEATREYMKAEARFLRAYYYYFLFRQYGPVYVLGDRMYEDTDISKIDRNTVDETVDWIVSELDKAIVNLPDKLSATTEGVERWQGRATKGAAMALKARVLMMAASPLYNGCELYKGQMKNLNGDFLFPQTPDPEKWEKAAKACKDVIDLNLYELCRADVSSDAFVNGAASYQKVFSEAWNSETIWGWWYRTENEYSSGTYTDLGAYGSLVAMQVPKNFGKYSYSGICPSLKLVDSYAMWETGRYPVTGYGKDSYGNDYSKPVIDAASGYKAEGWTENYKQPVDVDWAPAFRAHNSVVGREPRFYACIVPNGFYWPSVSNTNEDTIGEVAYEARKGGRFTTYDSDEASSRYSASGSQHSRTGFAWRKNYVANTSLETLSDYTVLEAVYPEFRLSEIYLSYAEASNETGDEAAALEYLNKVRNRVGLNDIEDAYPEVRGNRDLLRDLIRRDRQIEFAMEPLSFYDACRWMTAEEEYPAANWSLKCSATTYEESYERVSDEIALPAATFGGKDYFYPISHKWLQQTVNMTQNYGF